MLLKRVSNIFCGITGTEALKNLILIVMDSLLYKHISESQVLALAEEFEPDKCKEVRTRGGGGWAKRMLECGNFAISSVQG